MCGELGQFTAANANGREVRRLRSRRSEDRWRSTSWSTWWSDPVCIEMGSGL